MNQPSPINIVKEEWDYLIVLDACRYDYFERFWKEYLPKGRLHSKWSPGSCTDEWLKRSFPGTYNDIIYISANPHVCSAQTVCGYCAGDHFFNVVEVWQSDWNSNIDSVKPQQLTDVALRVIHSNDMNTKRFIIHYLQPHAPYLYFEIDYKMDSDRNTYEQKKNRNENSSQKFLHTRENLFAFFYRSLKHIKSLGNKPDWMLRKLFDLPPKAPMEYVLRKHNIKELRKAYKENMKAAFSETARLLQYLTGKIVITADHGEFLGENRNFSHPSNSSHPILRTVPWLVIEKNNKELEYQQDAQLRENKSSVTNNPPEDVIVERLRALGYHD